MYLPEGRTDVTTVSVELGRPRMGNPAKPEVISSSCTVVNNNNDDESGLLMSKYRKEYCLHFMLTLCQY